jgi:ribosomal protein S18 acetylase RimI-like enzyme
MVFSIKTADSLYPDEIQAIWNSAFGLRFPLSRRLWLQNTQRDPNFKLSDLLVAKDSSGSLAGFVLTKRFREAACYPGQCLETVSPLGFIETLVVKPEHQRQRLGRQLLTAAETKLWKDGAQKILLGSSFRHFFPGVPADNTAAIGFFEAAGYTLEKTPVEFDLAGPLRPEILEPATRVPGVTFRPGRSADQAGLLAFLTEVFPGRWFYEVNLFLEQGGDISDIMLAIDERDKVQGFLMSYWEGSRILGPTIYWQNGDPTWGGVGPLGVSPSLRGRGAGLGLTAAGLYQVYHRGVRLARIDWTSLVGFYSKLGFEPVQGYLGGHISTLPQLQE